MSNFVIKVPVVTDTALYQQLESRFEVARVFYNAILSECIKRRNRYRFHPAYAQGRESFRKYKETNDSAHKKLADEHIEIARKTSGYYLRSASKYGLNDSIEQYACQIIRQKKTWISQHLDSHVCLELCKRAFLAVKRSPKVYFKKRNRDFITSVSGKTMASSLTWKNNQVKWYGLALPTNFAKDDVKTDFVLKNPDKISFIRLSRILVKDQWHYYAEFTCEGVPPIKPKHTLGLGKVGVDFGPQKAGYYTSNLVKGVINLAGKLDFKQKKIRKLQRKVDRQRRANNPANFDEKGRCKPGPKKWIISKRQKQTLIELRESKRKEAAYRRCLHGHTANFLRSLGDELHIEKLEYKKWQQQKHGRFRLSASVTKRAPAMLVNLLKDKFLNTDGTVHEIDTYKTKLSQTCPSCKNIKKKTLRERAHYCEKCGLYGHRDIVSALLAICVNSDTNEINFDECEKYLSREMPTLANEVDGGKTCDLVPSGA